MLACVRISDEIYRAKHSLVIGNKIPYNILDVIVGQKVAVFLFLVDCISNFYCHASEKELHD